MTTTFLLMAVPIAALNWLAVWRGWKRLEYLVKPTVMVMLLAFAVSNGGLANAGMRWFILALALSLAGDIFLMLPKERFIAGLVSFLLAHLSYIVGLSPIPPLQAPHLVVAAIFLVLVALPAVVIYRRIAAALSTHGQRALQKPVLAYTVVISIMLLSALFTLLRDEWQAIPSLSVSAGAVLFFLSDAILAWNKFVEPIPNGRVWNMMSYHLGQGLLTLGAALHFLS